NPIALHNASASDLIPRFRKVFGGSREPVVSTTENPTLAKLEAAGAREATIHLLNPLIGNFHAYGNTTFQVGQWRQRLFPITDAGIADPFYENVEASKAISSGRCRIALETGSQVALNRLSLPEGSPNLLIEGCSAVRSKLTFVSSV